MILTFLPQGHWRLKMAHPAGETHPLALTYCKREKENGHQEAAVLLGKADQ